MRVARCKNVSHSAPGHIISHLALIAPLRNLSDAARRITYHQFNPDLSDYPQTAVAETWPKHSFGVITCHRSYPDPALIMLG